MRVNDQNAAAGMSFGSVTLYVLPPSKAFLSASRKPMRYCEPTRGSRMIMPGEIRSGPEPDYEATTGVFRLLIVILIKRATTVIDPVAATAAPALLRNY